MAAKHAVLSASSSERWLNCPPSARLCEAYEDKGSDYAAEGTDAHALCEFRLKQALGLPADDPIENLSWYNEEMEDCAAGYAAYVSELLEVAKQACADPVILIEQRVDFSRWVQDGFGTADCIVIADGELNIVDYKHGKGVEVSAVDNPQMMLYALGALEIFDGIYDIDTVRMTIYQPRKSNISVCVMEKDDLLEWAQNDLTYKAKLAYEGSGDFHCGEWCRFCKAKAECRERAEANLVLARYDFEKPALLSDEEISDILDKVDALNGKGAAVMDTLLEKVKANLILEHSADDALLQGYITAAVSYAESYQHVPEGTYAENPMPATTEQAVIMLASHFYESRDGSTGGFFADNVQAGQQVWNTVNLLLRLDREWKV